MKFFKNISNTSLHLILLGVIAVVAIAFLSWLSLSWGQADDFLSVGQVPAALRTTFMPEYELCIKDCRVLNEEITKQNNKKIDCKKIECPNNNKKIEQENKLLKIELSKCKDSCKNAVDPRTNKKIRAAALNNCKVDCAKNNKQAKLLSCNKECSDEKYLQKLLINCDDKCSEYALRKSYSYQVVTPTEQTTTISQQSTQSSTQSSLVAGTTDNVIAPTPGTAQNLATQIANIGNKNANTGSTQIAAPINVPIAPQTAPVVPAQQTPITSTQQVQPAPIAPIEPEQAVVLPQVQPTAPAAPTTQLDLQIMEGAKNNYAASELIDLKISAITPNGNPAKLIDGWNVAYSFFKYDSVYNSYAPYSESVLPQAGNLEFNPGDLKWHTLNLLAAQPIGRYNLFAPQILGKYKLQITLYCANTQKCIADTQVQKEILFDVPCTLNTQCGAGKYCDLGICRVALPIAPPVPACTYNSQCGAGQYCAAGVCKDKLRCYLYDQFECQTILRGGGEVGCSALLVTSSMRENCDPGSLNYPECVCRKIGYPYNLAI